MPGVSIQIANANFTRQLTSLMLPRRANLLGEYRFGVNFAASSKNYANNALPLVAVGAPAYGGTFGVSVSGGAGGVGFDTQITPPRDATLILLRKRIANAGASMGVVGNSQGNGLSVGAGTAQTGFRDDDTGTPQCQFYSNVAAAPNISATRNAPARDGNYFFEAGVTRVGQTHKLYSYAAGVQQIAVSTVVGNGWDHNVYVGTSNNGGNALWTTDVLHLGIYGAILTDAEIDAAYQGLKAFYALLGLTIN
jgi:hypothetical protein